MVDSKPRGIEVSPCKTYRKVPSFECDKDKRSNYHESCVLLGHMALDGFQEANNTKCILTTMECSGIDGVKVSLR